MEYGMFWDEPDEHQLRREREAGQAATERQRKRDGHETYRMQHMDTRPFCSDCGRNFAWVQYHDKRYCMACMPAEVEPIKPPDYVSHAVSRVYRKCGYCGSTFSYPEGEPAVYCSDECEDAKRASSERRRRRIIDMRTDAEMAGQAAINVRIVTAYVDRLMSLREIADEFEISEYQVDAILSRLSVVRRTRREIAQLRRERGV